MCFTVEEDHAIGDVVEARQLVRDEHDRDAEAISKAHHQFIEPA
jgi:nucleoside phosphorylase